MRNATIAPADPIADVTTGGRPAKCPDCGHAREGNPASVLRNKLRLVRGRPLLRPHCNESHDAEFDDYTCPCRHESHSENIVGYIRPFDPAV